MTTPPLQLVPDDAIESIEKAEEDDDLKTILDIINFISSDSMGDPDDDDVDGNDDWVEATEASLDAFYRMIKSGITITTKTTDTDTDTDTDPNTDTADTGAVVPSYYTLLNPIFAILNGWRKEEAIVEVALGCIVAITTKMIDQQQETEIEMEESITTVDIIDLIVVKIMQQLYKDESTIQEQACLAIEGLVLSPYYSMNVDFKDQLQYHIDENIIQTELKLARDERITNERNKSYPGRVAHALKITL
jgi:hypothetical protein